MILIPILYHRSVFNSFIKPLGLTISHLETLFIVSMFDRCSTKQVFNKMEDYNIYKRYLDINNHMMKLIAAGHVQNHERMTLRGTKRYLYSITLLGRSILADFDTHCQRFMDDYNAGKYPS